jgi:molybdopterin-binding protein
MSELITASEAAELLHLHPKRVQALARAGKIPAVRHGRKWLFKRSDLLRSAQSHGSHAETAPSSSSALEISARNRLVGRIVEIHADGVMAEVRLAVGDQELVAIITSSSAQRLHLKVGDEVLAVVKSTEVMIARPAG